MWWLLQSGCEILKIQGVISQQATSAEDQECTTTITVLNAIFNGFVMIIGT